MAIWPEFWLAEGDTLGTREPHVQTLKNFTLFLNHGNLTWEAFASKVRTYRRGFMGEPNEIRAGRCEFHENPSACICENSKAKKVSSTQNQLKVNSKGRKGSLSRTVGEPTYNPDVDNDDNEDNRDADEETELPDFDDNESSLQAKSISNWIMISLRDLRSLNSKRCSQISEAHRNRAKFCTLKLH